MKVIDLKDHSLFSLAFISFHLLLFLFNLHFYSILHSFFPFLHFTDTEYYFHLFLGNKSFQLYRYFIMN